MPLSLMWLLVFLLTDDGASVNLKTGIKGASDEGSSDNQHKRDGMAGCNGREFENTDGRSLIFLAVVGRFLF